MQWSVDQLHGKFACISSIWLFRYRETAARLHGKLGVLQRSSKQWRRTGLGAWFHAIMLQQNRSPSSVHMFRFFVPSHWMDHSTASWAAFGSCQKQRQTLSKDWNGTLQPHSQAPCRSRVRSLSGDFPSSAYDDTSSLCTLPNACKDSSRLTFREM